RRSPTHVPNVTVRGGRHRRGNQLSDRRDDFPRTRRGAHLMDRTLLVTCGHLMRHWSKFAGEIEGHGIKVSIPQLIGQQFDATEMREAIRGQQLVIAGDDLIDRSVLAAGRDSGLQAIIKWGIGTDGIDKDAAGELGISVYNTPGAFSEEVG